MQTTFHFSNYGTEIISSEEDFYLNQLHLGLCLGRVPLRLLIRPIEVLNGFSFREGKLFTWSEQ